MEHKSVSRTGSRTLLQGRLETKPLLDCHKHVAPHVPDRSLCSSSDLGLGQIDKLVLGTRPIVLETKFLLSNDSQADSQTVLIICNLLQQL